ncbi:hypothetical protein [Streptomyces sp. NRRL F-5123]|uniref:hypothetical protein n=1 Tax=Streptomyces sp. NRRL F-5123 TaxID=1463856 RepID=UPI0004E128BE|nr:hypothetical protein [Streptomyces sp. NRRL F-5123]
MDFEDRLGATLRHAAEAFTPDDPLSLVAAGHARGRRLRRRRTAGMVAGAVAVVLVAAGGAAAGTVLAHAGGPAGVSPATTRPVVTGGMMSTALSSLLPYRPVISVTGRPPGTGAHPAAPYAHALFQGDVHSYELVVSVGNPDSRRGTCPSPTPPVTCTVLPAQGGTLVITATSAFTAGGFGNAASISVWFRTDRYAVAVEERGPTSGTPGDLPVDQAGLVHIALDGVWRELAAMLPPSVPGPEL